MKINNGNDILPALPLYITIADDDINYNILILKTTVISVTNDISPARNIVIISYNGSSKEINLSEVTNQPTWTNDLPGSLIAITDIDSWVVDSSSIAAGDNNIGNVDVVSMPDNLLSAGSINGVAQVVSITVPPGASTVSLQIAGIWSGQLEFEGSVDGTNFVSVYASNNTGNSTNASSGNGIFILPGGGFSIIRVRSSSWSSGTAIISFNASVGSSGAVLTQPLPTGDNIIGRFKLTDGTDVADIFDLVNSNPLSVAVVDINGDQITSFGGGTQYTEGDTDATIVGTAVMMEVAANTLQPIQGTIADGLLVNLGANNDVVVTGTVDVTGSVVAAVVSATDLDIRNLVFATDKVDVSGSTGVGVTGAFFQATQPVSATNLDIRDLLFATDKVDVSGSILGANSGVDIGDVTVNNPAGAGAVNIQDGGNSITVDGTFFQATQPVSAIDLDIRNLVFATDKIDVSGSTGIGVTGTFFQATQPISAVSLPLPTGAATAALQTQPGVDIGDVTVNNAAGAAAVNVQDGGNSITVDGVFFQATQPVSATDLDIRNLVFATDKVDASGTVLGAGTNNIGDVDIVTMPAITGSVTANAGTNLNTSALNLEATQADVRTSLQIIDDWDETDRAKVNLIVGQAGVQGGSGAVSANTQRVVLATDVALPAGTNNIGDVDILSIVPGTAATNLGKAEDVAHVTGDTGVMVLGVSNELGTALVNANGDYTPIATDKMGQIYVNPENNKVLFRGRSASFRTLGRAGTAGQKILAIHNATGSSITVNVNKIVVDNFCTVVKAITVAPPIVRIWKFTAVPTNGTVLTKNKIGGTSTSDASATVRGDASADGTGSGTTLTVTLPAGTILDQKVAKRTVTSAENNPISLEFYYPNGIKLAPLEGVCVFLDYTLATQNPVTDMWMASVEWEESTT